MLNCVQYLNFLRHFILDLREGTAQIDRQTDRQHLMHLTYVEKAQQRKQRIVITVLQHLN